MNPERRGDSLWRLMRQASSVQSTLPSLTEAERKAAEPTECLAEDAILAFVEGVLSRAELVRAHRHLDSCETCQILVAEAAHVVSGGVYESADGEPVAKNLVSATVLGERYRIQRFIARGGMGEVYEAYDRVLQERIALKTVTATVSDNPKAVRRLMAEVQLARRVSHPNVCRIYDLGSHGSEAGTIHFLTMEYVQGESLAKRLLREGYVPVAEASHIARHLLKGLGAAHEAGILHRDFKTDNVMLSPAASGYPRGVIMDFGLARALDADPGRLTTGANQPLVGTLSYMAPEQVEGSALSARTDIFAFGIVFYEMLTGHLPFAADSPAAAALRRLRDRPKRPSHHSPDLQPQLDELVLKCLSRDPMKRYGSAAHVLRDLDAMASTVSAPQPKSRPRWTRVTVPVMGVAAVLAAWMVLAPGRQGSAPAAERKAADPAPVRLQPAAPERATPKRLERPAPKPEARAEVGPTQTTPDAPSRPGAPKIKAPAARTLVVEAPPPPNRAEPSAEPITAPAKPEQSATGANDDGLIVPEIFQQSADKTSDRPDTPSSASELPSARPGPPHRTDTDR